MNTIIESLEDDLKQIETETPDPLECIKRSLSSCHKALSLLWEKVDGLPNERPNTDFEKDQIYGVLTHLIYYMEYYNIWVKLPIGFPKKKIKFFNREFRTRKAFKDKHEILYHIFGNNNDNLEKLHDLSLNTTALQDIWRYAFINFPGITTIDIIGLSLKANKRLMDSLIKEINRLSARMPIPGAKSSDKVQWMSSKLELYKMACALKASRNINHGKLSVKTIYNELLDGVDIKGGKGKGAHPSFKKLRKCKGNPTKLLDRFKKVFIEYLDNLDDNK